MGVMRRLKRLDDAVAQQWPALFAVDTRRRFGTMITFQVIAAVVLFIGAGTGSARVTTIAAYPVLATLIELVRLMPSKASRGDAG